ncbi:MAG: DUF1080 domain-containing protein [Planctomycetes bacterium]|nr:DUF1080 domain-containing protein [Planctomycetota bacterium]
MIAALFALALAQEPAREADYYAVDFLPTPAGSLEVGGLAFLPDGRLAVSTRHGQVWLIGNPLAPNPADTTRTLFAEGLYEGLGLHVVDGELYVVQRTELSRLRDTDGDDRCDTIDTITDEWGVSGNYHEFAYGLPRDAAGNFYVSLNVSFFDPKWWHGKSPAKWRGWIVQVAPDGSVTPWATGLRSPNGMGFNAAGDLFVTDNQGDWMPSGPLFHVKRGAFYGHPAGLRWTDEYLRAQREPSDTEAPLRPREPAAVWFPYGLSRSAGNPLLEDTAGKFGPFAGQLFVPELTNGCVVRVDLEQVEGEYQGACFQFRRDTGSANRIAFAPDGTLIVGLTSRGWGGAPPGDGIARVRWLGRVPMEMASVRLADDGSSGFDVAFTLPLADDCQPTPADVRLVQYDYASWWDYGSPELHVTNVPVTAVKCSGDRRMIRIDAPTLEAGKVARLLLDRVVGQGARGREPLLHAQADYTVNRLRGMPTARPIAKSVLPPAAREDQQEGWVTLFNRRSIAAWTAPGWKLAAVHLDPRDPTRFAEHDMVDEWDGLLVAGLGGGATERAGATASEPQGDAISLVQHGDCDARIEFCLPRGGNSGVYFQGRYEVQLLDSFGKASVGFGDCGGIYAGESSFVGSAPLVNACNAPGEWQRLDVRFRAPRFDEAGQKIANARFDWVELNGQRVQQDVELPEPTRGALEGGEVAYGPLRLQGDHGPVAYKKVRLRRIERDEEAGATGALATLARAASGWSSLFDGATLTGWSSEGEAQWRVEQGVLVAEGGDGVLRRPMSYAKGREWRMEVKLEAGASGEWALRSQADAAGLRRFEVTAPLRGGGAADGLRTGSLWFGPPSNGGPGRLSACWASLVPDGVWFELRLRHVVVGGRERVELFVNDVLAATFERDEPAGRDSNAVDALELRHAASAALSFREIWVRELR